MKILKRNQIIISVIALMLITVGYMNYTSNITASVETGALMDAEKMAGIGDAKLVNSNNVASGSEDGTNENTNIAQSISDNSKENAESAQSSISNNNNNNNNETAESSINDVSQNNIVANETTTEKQNNTNNQTSNTNLKSEIGDGVSSQNNQSNKTSTQTSASTYGTEYFASSKLERDKMYSQMVETYQNLLESNTTSAEQRTISTQEITNINNQKNSIMIAENLIKNLGFNDVVIFVNGNSTSVIVKAEKLEEADIAQIQNIVCREIGVEAETIHISLK